MRKLAILFSLAVLGVLAVRAELVMAADPPAATIRLTSTFPISAAPAQYEVVHQILEFASGAGTREHRHGGSGFVTVLEGQSTRREGDLITVHRPRETYTEPFGALHSVRATGRTRVFASFLLSPGSVQTINDPNAPVPESLNTTPVLARTMVNTQPAEFTLTQIVVDFAPVAVMAMHRHGGQGIATVIEGEISFRTAESEVTRTTGGSYTNIMSPHEIRNVSSSAATVIITVLVPKDSEALSFR